MRPLIISPSQAVNYYYEKDPIFHHDSQLLGSLAVSYQISGEQCQKSEFRNLIVGNDLNGNQVIKDGIRLKSKKDRIQIIEKHHRAAVDIPYSAPKSVSITALHFGDSRLIHAHKEAINQVCKQIQKDYIFARQTKHGMTSIRNTGEGLFALFHHSTSRANDPQLHTHVLLLNHTLTPKGHRAVCFDKIFADQVLLNNMYQNELAKRVKGLGYDIEYNGNGGWEISGIKREWIQDFSKRRSAIDPTEKKLTEYGKYSEANPAKLRTIATLESRPSKDSSISKEGLQKQWEMEVPRQEIKKALELAKRSTKTMEKISPEEHLRLAYHDLNEREALFQKKDLFVSALQLSRGEHVIADFEKAFSRMIRDKEVVYISKGVSNRGMESRFFTSRDMKDAERQILNAFEKGMDSVEALIPKPESKKFIARSYAHLSADQRKAVYYLLTNQNQFNLIQGDAGTGKTTAVKSVREILEHQRPEFKIVGLGYTGKAAQELSKTGIESKTITSFLNEPLGKNNSGRLIICDEASMLGSFQTRELIDKITFENSRLVLIGDGKQLQSLSAGKIFTDLQKMDFSYVKMSRVLRQKNEKMQRTVGLIKAFQEGKNRKGIDKVFSLLDQRGNVIENQSRSSLKASIVKSYCCSKKLGDILVISQANKDRIELNNQIRKALQKDGKLDRKEVTMRIAVPVQLPGIKRYFAENYSVGKQVFVERQNHEKNQKERFDGIVTGINKAENSIQILVNDSRVEWVNLRDKRSMPTITIYDQQERHFSKKDKIVFTKNDKFLGVQNGAIGFLEKVDKDCLQVRINGSKRIIKIDPGKDPFIDHGYAVSCFKAQGATSKEVLFWADTRYKGLNKTESFYVAASRAQYRVSIFTNDAQRLKEQFKEGQEKTSTLLPTKDLMKSINQEKQTEMEIER